MYKVDSIAEMMGRQIMGRERGISYSQIISSNEGCVVVVALEITRESTYTPHSWFGRF